jgi:hypothetical protein
LLDLSELQGKAIQGDRPRPDSKAHGDSISMKIKLEVEFNVTETGLEDALAEYDELTVEGLMEEILDKCIACDQIHAKVSAGPNTLEEYDQAANS